MLTLVVASMKTYRDEIAMLCHEIVEDGYRSGLISDIEMREFEADCFIKESKTTYENESTMKKEQIRHVPA